jgi:hypothetical protein
MGLGTGQLVAYSKKEQGFSNFTQEESQNKCEAVYEAMGAEAYNKCVPAYASSSSKSDAKKVDKYVSALLSGFEGTYEEFRKENLMDIGTTIASLGMGLVNIFKPTETSGSYTPPTSNGSKDEDGKSNTGIFVVVGILAAAGIGYAVYKSTK